MGTDRREGGREGEEREGKSAGREERMETGPYFMGLRGQTPEMVA